MMHHDIGPQLIIEFDKVYDEFGPPHIFKKSEEYRFEPIVPLIFHAGPQDAYSIENYVGRSILTLTDAGIQAETILHADIPIDKDDIRIGFYINNLLSEDTDSLLVVHGGTIRHAILYSASLKAATEGGSDG